jgi:para-aminobenzoate synthetase component 1
VEEVRRSIAAGDVYQVNLVGHRSAPFAGSVDQAAASLAALPGTPYAGGVAGDGWAVVSASPELFLSVGAGSAVTRPIKGTLPRTVAAEDEGAAHTLRASTKDRAEHVMIVDLERNDLGRVARPGGVKVSRLYGVDPLAGMWHAVSEVTARLRPGVGVAELLTAAFPGGSVTGAPKLAALRDIGRLEPVGRGPAMGALGWVAPDGSMTLGLTIRTFAVAAGRIHAWAGGGITWGSDPAAEVAEAEAKLDPLLAALAGQDVPFRPIGPPG